MQSTQKTRGREAEKEQRDEARTLTETRERGNGLATTAVSTTPRSALLHWRTQPYTFAFEPHAKNYGTASQRKLFETSFIASLSPSLQRVSSLYTTVSITRNVSLLSGVLNLFSRISEDFRKRANFISHWLINELFNKKLCTYPTANVFRPARPFGSVVSCLPKVRQKLDLRDNNNKKNTNLSQWGTQNKR
jgi:hypothetical protein